MPLSLGAVAVALSPLLLITSCAGFGLSPAKHHAVQPCSHRHRRIVPKQITHKHKSLSATLLCQGAFPSRLGATSSSSGDADDSAHYIPSTSPTRPAWALPWMPTWLITLRPRTQFVIGLALYVFHLRILTQHQIAFPFQLIPNDEGWFQSIGLDSLAGMMSFAGLVWLRKASVAHVEKTSGDGSVVAVPPIWSDPTESEAPWRFRPKGKKTKDISKDGAATGGVEQKEQHPRSTSAVAFALLTAGYFSTGRFSLLFENLLYAAAGYGFPLTVPMVRISTCWALHVHYILAYSYCYLV